MADQEDGAAPGGQPRPVERPAAQLLGQLRLDSERLAGQPRGLRRPHPGAGQAGVDLDAEGRQRAARGLGLPFPLRGQPPRVVVAVAVLGVAVSEQSQKRHGCVRWAERR